MPDHSTQLVQKLWNYCNILRDDGLSYGDYVEQLTFLLFVKMADEQSRPPFNPLRPMGYGGQASRGRRSSGFTTCARTCISRSRKIR